MALPLRPSLLPQCTTCTRRLTLSLFADRLGPSSTTQVRGKKKLANTPDTITVRLLQNTPAFGRAGSLVPISVGQMRNEWYPRRVAEYVTAPALKELRVKNIAMERDFEYGMGEEGATAGKKMKGGRRRAEEAVAAAAVQELGGPREQRVEVERISILLPPRLDFRRQIIEPTPEAPPEQSIEELQQQQQQQQQQLHQQRQRQPRSSSTAASDLLAARSGAPKPSVAENRGPKPIFGSVSNVDVANAMRVALSTNEEASKVVIADEDVRFFDVKDEQGKLGETDRVKQTGDYQVELRVRGVEHVVRRVVRVLAQDAA